MLSEILGDNDSDGLTEGLMLGDIEGDKL